MVFIKTYRAPAVCKKEILRYAGCKGDTDLYADILDECISEALPELTYKVCYSVFDVKIKGDECDFGAFKIKSKDLTGNLENTSNAVVFAATLGVGIDRLISRYIAVSPSKAVIFGAIGAERIESLCDLFCKDIKLEYKTELKPRFSPGYGDVDLLYQKDIFSVLSPGKHIGLTLNESMLMSPSKSVTAIAGFTDKSQETNLKCNMCDNKNCLYRGDI